LLRKTDEEVGKVEAGVADWARAAGREFGSFESGEDEGAFGIFCGAETLQDAAIVATEAPVVLAFYSRKTCQKRCKSDRVRGAESDCSARQMK